MSSKPPRPARAGGGDCSSSALSSPRNEAEIASFLLQLKHHSPCRVHDKHDREERADEKSERQSSYQYSPASSYGETTIAGSNRSSLVPSYSSRVWHDNRMSIPWDTLLNQSNLVLLKDRDLVPDALFVAMAQMVPCRLTPSDRVGCYKTRPVGYLGLCCGHCGGQPGFGRFYPNSVRSLAQTTTSQTILKHVTSKCRFCPDHIRQAILDFHHLSEMEDSPVGRPRYGSRKVFFQRIWHRLHQNSGDVEGSDGCGSSGSSASSLCGEEEETASLVPMSEGKHSATDDAASHVTPSDLDEEHSLATYSNDTTDEAAAAPGPNHKLDSGSNADASAVHWGGKQVKLTSPVHRLTAD